MNSENTVVAFNSGFILAGLVIIFIAALFLRAKKG